MHTEEQVKGWRLVTDAVHRNGGRIVAQLWHVGRISHTDLQPNGAAPVAPSAIRADSQTSTSKDSGKLQVSQPRALNIDEIPAIVEQYRSAAQRAKDAGFDGVEIHGANGYLPDQFTREARTNAPTPTAALSKTASASRSKSPRRSPMSGAPGASATASQRPATSTP